MSVKTEAGESRVASEDYLIVTGCLFKKCGHQGLPGIALQILYKILQQ